MSYDSNVPVVVLFFLLQSHVIALLYLTQACIFIDDIYIYIYIYTCDPLFLVIQSYLRSPIKSHIYVNVSNKRLYNYNIFDQ